MSDTNNIGVTVSSEYLRDQSEPEENRFTFGYTIVIHNHGTQPARLLSRHWVITDADGNVQEVHGDGVIGEKPLIHPGRSFRYSSGAILATPVGSMHGTYTMVSQSGIFFDAIIPAFSLAMPELVH